MREQAQLGFDRIAEERSWPGSILGLQDARPPANAIPPTRQPRHPAQIMFPLHQTAGPCSLIFLSLIVIATNELVSNRAYRAGSSKALECCFVLEAEHRSAQQQARGETTARACRGRNGTAPNGAVQRMPRAPKSTDYLPAEGTLNLPGFT
jgi:hypothetical protein